MSTSAPRLSVVISPKARRDLSQIWQYNSDAYDDDHADAYVEYLLSETAKLETRYLLGKPVPSRRDLRFRIIRKGSGHGHYVVYRILTDNVEVLHYFHTAQDWRRGL